MANLSGEQLSKLHNAIIEAFPQPKEWEMLLRFRLETRLASIAPNSSSFSSTVFDVLQWAEAHGRIDELVCALREERPSVEIFARVANEFESRSSKPSPPVHPPPHDLAGRTQSLNTQGPSTLDELHRSNPGSMASIHSKFPGPDPASMPYAADDSDYKTVSSNGESRIQSPSSTPEHSPGIPPGGRVPLDAAYYVERAVDNSLNNSLQHRGGLISLWGPRQTGKSSLLTRCVSQWESGGRRGAFVDISGFGRVDYDRVLFSICRSVAEQVRCDAPDSNNFDWHSFQRFLRRLPEDTLVAIDEVDSLFAIGAMSDFAMILRSMFEQSFREDNRLRVVLCSAADPERFSDDIYLSPFVPGVSCNLPNFTQVESSLLFQRCGVEIAEEDHVRLFQLIGGQPYLSHLATWLLRGGTISLDEIVAFGGRPNGPFSSHLSHLAKLVRQSTLAKRSVLKLLMSSKLQYDELNILLELGIARFSDSPQYGQHDIDPRPYGSGAARISNDIYRQYFLSLFRSKDF